MISNVEWEVMRVLWTGGLMTSNVIIEVLYAKLGWLASTVKTLLRRLLEKGVISSVKQGRSYLYKTEISEKSAYLSELNDVLGRICITEQSSLFQELLRKLPMTESDLIAFETLLLSKKSELVDVVRCNCVIGQCRCHRKETSYVY